MLTIAYNGGGWLQDCVRMQKKKKIYEPQKKLLHCYVILCIEKCKPVLSYK